MEFKLTIKLGNSEMQAADDIAVALSSVVHKLEEIGFQNPGAGDGGYIRDINGNRVGRWVVE